MFDLAFLIDILPELMRGLIVTVEATRHARASWSWACSPDTIGTRAADRAPAATSWNIRSGSRNAAKK